MVSTLTHRTHHLSYEPIITLILLEAEVSLIDKPNVEIVSDTNSIANLHAMGFRQQGGIWMHHSKMILNRDRDTNVNGLALDVDFDIEHQVLDIDVIINDDDNDDDKDQFNEQ